MHKCHRFPQSGLEGRDVGKKELKGSGTIQGQLTQQTGPLSLRGGTQQAKRAQILQQLFPGISRLTKGGGDAVAVQRLGGEIAVLCPDRQTRRGRVAANIKPLVMKRAKSSDNK